MFFFVVQSFRDRRYEYKGLNKVWKGKLSEAKASGNPIKIQEAQVTLYLLSQFFSGICSIKVVMFINVVGYGGSI